MVVALVLLPIVCAIFVFGSLIHLYIGEQAAAAEGARAAGAAGGFGPHEYAVVLDNLHSNGIDSSACTVQASSSEVALGDPIAVTVTCPQRVGIPFLLDEEISIDSTFVARGEVNR